MDCFATDDAGDETAACHDRDTLRCGYDGVYATDRLEMQEPFVRDVLHNKPDLIAVAGEHDTRFASGIANAKDVAHDIGTDVVAPGPNPLPHELLHIVLVAGRARRFDESFEKIFAVGVHDLRNQSCPGATRPTSEEVRLALAGGSACGSVQRCCLEIFAKLSAVSERFLFVCGTLLVFANVAFGNGTYQRTKDGKTLVWNNHPNPGDEAKWSGDRDREGYATGFGTLAWYSARGRETGSTKPALYARYWGNMVRGKFNGPVNSHSKGKTDHAVFADGVQMTRWAAGPAPSQIATEPAKRLAVAKPEMPNVQRPTEVLPPRPAAEEAVAQPENVQRPIIVTPTANSSTTPVERDVTKQGSVERQKSSSEGPIVETPAEGPSPNESKAGNAQLRKDSRVGSPTLNSESVREQAAQRPTISDKAKPEMDNSLRLLAGPPSSLHTDATVKASTATATPEPASAAGSNARLTMEEVTDLADGEARAQGYNLDEYQRPKADYSAVEDKWSLFYDQKAVDTTPEIGKYFSATVDDKTRKVEIKK
jgi:hypothetical protein